MLVRRGNRAADRHRGVPRLGGDYRGTSSARARRSSSLQRPAHVAHQILGVLEFCSPAQLELADQGDRSPPKRLLCKLIFLRQRPPRVPLLPFSSLPNPVECNDQGLRTRLDQLLCKPISVHPRPHQFRGSTPARPTPLVQRDDVTTSRAPDTFRQCAADSPGPEHPASETSARVRSRCRTCRPSATISSATGCSSPGALWKRCDALGPRSSRGSARTDRRATSSPRTSCSRRFSMSARCTRSRAMTRSRSQIATPSLQLPIA